MLMKKEVREALSNVWFDTAASPYIYTPDIYRVAVDIMGPEKIIFGSDYPLLKPGRYLKEMESLSLSPETINRLLRINAAQLLKL